MAGNVIDLVAQTTTSSAWVDTPVLREVPEADAARFTDVLRGPDAVTSASPTSAPPALAPIEPGHLGDTILRAMQSAGSEYAAKSGVIHSVLASDSNHLSATDMLRLQVQLTDASMFVDLLGKAVSKSTQHIDQLTKLQ